MEETVSSSSPFFHNTPPLADDNMLPQRLLIYNLKSIVMQNTEKLRVERAIETVNGDINSTQESVGHLITENRSLAVWGNKLDDKTPGQVQGMLIENSMKADFLEKHPEFATIGKEAGADPDAYFKNATAARTWLQNSNEIKKLNRIGSDLFGVRGILQEKLDAINRAIQEQRAEDMIK